MYYFRVKKPFRCTCGKSYRTPAGLRHHSMIAHTPGASSSVMSPLNAGNVTQSVLNTIIPQVISNNHLTSSAIDVSLKGVTSSKLPALTQPVTSPVPLNISTHHHPLEPVQPKPVMPVAITTESSTNCNTVQFGAIFPKVASNRQSMCSLLPSQNGSSSLPPGTLAFASLSGGLKVAVPVSKVIPFSTTKLGSEQLGMFDENMDVLESFGALETVETFTGLETSIDDTKAD